MPPIKKGTNFKSGSGFVRSCYYFDNNGTTFAPPEVMDAICDALRLGNASTDYAKEAKRLLGKFRKQVINRVANKNSVVIITSGASESINTFFRSTAEMYPGSHFIISAIEHGTSLGCIKRLKDLGQIKYSLVHPRSDGCIHVADIVKLIRKNTKVVSIMHVNNETGSINDIDAIQKLCHRHNIWYHADTVQSFGKYRLPKLDACSVSFHKMYGPPGIGCLILDHRLIYHGFEGQITGTQNFGLRGGTENLPGIAGASKAMEITFRDRDRKNQKLMRMRKFILDELRKHFIEDDFQRYVGKSDHFRGFTNDLTFVQIGGKNVNGKEGAPNVLMVSFIKPKATSRFCNVNLKKDLMKQGIYLSIGSACHTSKSGASHVLHAMKAPFIVRCGVIRISLGDYNTLTECKEMIQILIDQVKKNSK